MIIIAEAGVNHNGNIDTARRLIDAAADAGADYVKFQTFNAEALVAPSAALAGYQRANTHDAWRDQLAMLSALQLSAADHLTLIQHCRERGIKFLSTAFDLESVDLLHSLHPDFWKIPSGQVTDYQYLCRIARYGGRIAMSTGMCTYADITAAVDTLTANGIRRQDITLLHCNTQYPTPVADVNLSAMTSMARDFGMPVGYSDHTVGIEIPIAAAAMGATVIEKHLTLDRSMPGPDQKASLTPDEMRMMVDAVRNVAAAIGDGVKRVTESERTNIAAARKSIIAQRDIKKGEILDNTNICARRPGTGLSPMMWPQVAGTPAIRDFKKNEQIEI